MQQQSWQAKVVECLCGLRRAGLDFESSWKKAMTLHPPRGRDCGPERPTLWSDGEMPLVAFFRRACDDAWHGRQPALQHFHPSLLIERDETRHASITTRHRSLAA